MTTRGFTHDCIHATLIAAALALTACGSINNADPSAKKKDSTSQFSQTDFSAGDSFSNSGGLGGITTSPSPTPTVSSAAPTLVDMNDTPSSQTVPLGSSVTLAPLFDGFPAPTFQWYKDGAKISGATGPYLFVTPNSINSYGTYMVIATNTYGSAQSTGMVIAPRVGVDYVGSYECNNAQCWADAVTAEKVCKMRHGDTAVLYSPSSWSPANIKYHNGFCSWNGSTWSCDTSCKSSCNGSNVLGMVQCLL